MPTDFAFKTMNAVHRTILKVSGGRAGWTVSKMPALELTTIGRKSGQARTVMLTAPVIEGSTLVIVASRGGDDVYPAWFLNLKHNPTVTVSMQGQPPVRMTARIADTTERSRLWPLITADHKQYAGYQTKTEREIPLVLLQPAE
jgi:deazaflavin-dependent oxidoreductase (nitroreductase family)